MSRSIVTLGTKWFESDDSLLGVWSAIAVEEVLNMVEVPAWLMNLASSLDLFVRVGSMFPGFDSIDFDDTDQINGLIDLNTRVKGRLTNYGDHIEKEECQRFKIGGTIWIKALSTSFPMKIVGSIHNILTKQLPHFDFFPIHDLPEGVELKYKRS